MEPRVKELEDAKNDHATRITILEMVTHDAKAGLKALSIKQDDMNVMLSDYIKADDSNRNKLSLKIIGSLAVLVLSLVAYIFTNHLS